MTSKLLDSFNRFKSDRDCYGEELERSAKSVQHIFENGKVAESGENWFMKFLFYVGRTIIQKIQLIEYIENQREKIPLHTIFLAREHFASPSSSLCLDLEMISSVKPGHQ